MGADDLAVKGMCMGHFLHGDWLCLEACGTSPAAHTLGTVKRRDRRTFLLKLLSPQCHSGTNTVTGAILVGVALSATSLSLCAALPRHYIIVVQGLAMVQGKSRGIQLGGVNLNVGLGKQNAIQQYISIIHCNGHVGQT